jgi:hypothetical protein
MRIIRIESDEPSRPANLFSRSSTLFSSFVMIFLSSSTTELSVGAIAGAEGGVGSMGGLSFDIDQFQRGRGDAEIQMDARMRFGGVAVWKNGRLRLCKAAKLGCTLRRKLIS